VIVNRRQLDRVCCVFVELDNGYRLHRLLELTPPDLRRATVRLVTPPTLGRVHRRDRLGGLINEYHLAA
jgi:hypothetical protein